MGGHLLLLLFQSLGNEFLLFVAESTLMSKEPGNTQIPDRGLTFKDKLIFQLHATEEDFLECVAALEVPQSLPS